MKSFGKVYRDLVTGFEGILVGTSQHITGCERYKLVNEKDDEKWQEEGLIEFVSEGIYDKIQGCNHIEDIQNAKFDFGDTLQDTITEFAGKVVVIHIAITGDISYALSPKFSAKNKENEAVWFDEGRLKLVASKTDTETYVSEKRVGGIANPGMKAR